MPPKATAYQEVADRVARVPAWRALAGGGAFIGNETAPGADDASPAGLLIGPAGRQGPVAVYGVELGARTRREEGVFAARDCVGGRCTLRSGPGLTAQLLAHWRDTASRPPLIGLDVDGTLVERYVPGERGFVHATLDAYPALARELVALAHDRHPFFFLTRSALGSVRTRVLDPLGVALAQADVAEPLPTWVVSSSLTVLDEVRWADAAAGTGSLQVLRDPDFGQAYRILPAELAQILGVVGANAHEALLAEAYARAVRWEQALLEGPAKWPQRTLARFRALLGAGLRGLSPDSPQLVPAVELRPGPDDARVVVINPIASGFRDPFAARLARALGGERGPTRPPLSAPLSARTRPGRSPAGGAGWPRNARPGPRAAGSPRAGGCRRRRPARS
ncbi:MAG: hypothetical protein IPG96_07230 [Proteobacteria bacterium]|nr:hypothetical protein [Pseudomonadota bacterium]